MSHATGLEVVKPRRKSAFREIGLFEDEEVLHRQASPKRPSLKVRFRSKNDIFEHTIPEKEEDEWEDTSASCSEDETSVAIVLPKSCVRTTPSDKFALVAFVIIISTLIAQLVPLGKSRMLTAEAAPPGGMHEASELALRKRQESNPTDWCKKWSQQSALVNGTLYLFGGRKTTSSSQSSDTWNNDFLTIDLSTTWQISSPQMAGLPQPSGPPPVANGYLWNSHDSLFLYGGEFSDNPQGTPTANSLWEYDINAQKWVEHESPQTSDGKNAEPAGESIQRAAEGAGFSLASLGRGWYFGGHLDFLTTEAWSIQTPRIYLKSFVEFTFPGVKNPEISSQTAGSSGEWRNLTSAGIQDTAGFTQRADGILVYVPGFGDEGILLSLAGGTNETFTQMNEVDVFDIAGSQWYRQATSGTTPKIRVNPCAVVAAAADGSSYNIYMFGGQNLIPYGDQTQYDDMWILSVPSFTWIQVNMDGQSVPYGRSGHTCNIWDGQMVMVGGYIGQDNALTCETPGIYVFNASSLQWTNQFTALSAGSKDNHFSQQNAQKGLSANDGLEGSYDYQVPAIVQSVIGGNANGGATLTTPANAATAGPLASGKPITYTVSGGGSTAVGGGKESNGHSNKGPVIGAIVAGVIGFILLLLVIYFAICVVIYRKQLALYRQHVALMQEQQADKEGSANASIYASHSPTWSRRPQAAQHESLIGPYHRPSNSQDTSGTSTHQLTSSSPSSSTDDLMEGYQPSFWGWNGVLLHPRRSLRIVNRTEDGPPRRDSE